MPVGAAVAAVGATAASGVASANAQKKASRRAADAQVQAADAATALEREIYYDQRDLLEPSIAAGSQAQARRMLMAGYTPAEVKAYLRSTDAALGGERTTGGNDLQSRYPAQYARYLDANGDGRPGPTNANLYGSFENYLSATEGPDALTSIEPDTSSYDWVDDWNWEPQSPSYDWRVSEGERALERSAAASGGLFSGDTGMALTQYGQDMGRQEFEADWRRLGELAGSGEDSNRTVVNVAGNYGSSAAANTIAAGNARASGYRGEGQAETNMWNTIGGAIGAGYGLGNKAGWFGR